MRRAWIAGRLYASVLIVAGLACWSLGLDLVPRPPLVYGVAASGVVVFRRGLYNGSIVSGLLLPGTAVGPSVGAALEWSTDVRPETGTARLFVTGVATVFGIGVAAQIIRALVALWSGER